MSPHATPADEAPTTTTLALGTVADGCPSCGAPLATDQRYCLRCGARRGRARFTAATFAAPAATTTTTVEHAEALAPAGPRVSASTTLVAGVATLLLALGVGVLIGQRSGTSSGAQRAAAPQVITVGAAAAAPGAIPAATTAGAAKAGAGKPAKAAKTKVVHVRLSAKTQQAAAQAAAKVLGKSAPKKPTVQPGESCDSSDPGCKNGKFTGDFFGP